MFPSVTSVSFVHHTKFKHVRFSRKEKLAEEVSDSTWFIERERSRRWRRLEQRSGTEESDGEEKLIPRSRRTRVVRVDIDEKPRGQKKKN